MDMVLCLKSIRNHGVTRFCGSDCGCVCVAAPSEEYDEMLISFLYAASLTSSKSYEGDRMHYIEMHTLEENVSLGNEVSGGFSCSDILINISNSLQKYF